MTETLDTQIKIWETKSNEELCLEYQQTKDNRLFEYFLSRNIGLIHDYIQHIIRKYPEQEEQLIEQCTVAMWNAMLEYKPEKEAKFSTYVYVHFKKNLRYHIREQKLIAIPYYLQGKQDEVAKKIPYASSNILSLNETIHNQSGLGLSEATVEDYVASTDPDNLDELIKQDEHNHLIKLMYKYLSPRQINCIMLYYGLDGQGPRTLQQVGDMYGLTRERIRQIIEKALLKLKRFMLKEKEYEQADS